MNTEYLQYIQKELHKEQKRRSILGQIYKLSKEPNSEDKIKKLKERMNEDGEKF